MTLSALQIEQFTRDGFVKVEGAFAPETAAACREILWRDLGLSPDRPEEWTQPVVRLGMYGDPPFCEALNSPRLHGALDQLAGEGRWVMPAGLGAMVVRFPAKHKPWDDGWHIDASFPPPADPASQDYFQWRVNFVSRSRSMLMLFLLSDCGPDDAPTRVRVGSHMPMARQLKAHGEAGVSLAELAHEGFDSSAGCEEVMATGEAGTVWLLHPFTVHAAQAHRGRTARFLAQPGLGWREGPDILGGVSPVERAIRTALER
jgi:Phytanoyl-CoA dioxygenase (PhyH)